MDQKKTMSVHSRIRSFGYAFNGISQVFKQEPNAKLHLLATLLAITAGIIRHINLTQWVAIIFAIALVWITEAFNTCLEQLCDFCCNKEFHPSIKIIKDISAGAVLIAALTSVVIGIIVFFL